MNNFKEQWNLEMALEVLGSETVAGDEWSAAVRWLLLYGPPQLKEILAEASAAAFAQCFPGVKVRGHSEAGQPYYGLEELAVAIGLSIEEVTTSLAELQASFGIELLVAGDRVYKVN